MAITAEQVVTRHGGFVKSRAVENKPIVESAVLGLEVDDLIQEYNLAIVGRIHKYDPERGAVTTFLGAICDDVNRMLLRKHSKAIETFDYHSVDEMSPEEPHYDTPLAAIEVQERIAERSEMLSRYAKEYAFLAYGDSSLVDEEMARAQFYDKCTGVKRKMSTDRSTMAVAILRKKYARSDGTCIAAIDDVVVEFKRVFGDTI